jgi:hypothetical protein
LCCADTFAVDLRLADGAVYTVTADGWRGPDPAMVELLNDTYPPNSPMAHDPVAWAALDAARELRGEIGAA